MAVYAMLYRGGFAIPATIEDVAILTTNNSEVEITELANLAEAYVYACRRYVAKELKQNAYVQLALPRFEDVIHFPFHAPMFVEQVPTRRVFAILNRDFVGIFTSIESSLEFLNEIHPCWLKEFGEYDLAISWVHRQVMRRILPMSAYFSGNIPYLKKLPLDTAVPIPYVQWLTDHYKPDPRLTFGSNFLIESQQSLEANNTASHTNAQENATM